MFGFTHTEANNVLVPLSDTSAWCSDEFPACCGKSQSPVDIELKSVASRSPMEDDLAYRTFGYDSNLKGRLHNNGHTGERNFLALRTQ